MNTKDVTGYLTQAVIYAKMAKQCIEQTTREGDWTPTFEVLDPLRKLGEILGSTTATIECDLGSYHIISPQSRHFVSAAAVRKETRQEE